MKSITLIIGSILIVTNLLFGLLLSSYSAFNLYFTTGVLILTTALVYTVHSTRLSDATKVAFTILLPLLGFFKLILGIIAPEHIQDNWCLIACIILTVFELIMLFTYSKITCQHEKIRD